MPLMVRGFHCVFFIIVLILCEAICLPLSCSFILAYAGTAVVASKSSICHIVNCRASTTSAVIGIVLSRETLNVVTVLAFVAVAVCPHRFLWWPQKRTIDETFSPEPSSVLRSWDLFFESWLSTHCKRKTRSNEKQARLDWQRALKSQPCDESVLSSATCDSVCVTTDAVSHALPAQASFAYSAETVIGPLNHFAAEDIDVEPLRFS